MKILVVGAGAVGGFYGASLARAGHAVTLVSRGSRGQLLAEGGVQVDHDGQRWQHRLPVLADLEQASGHGAEITLVCVKHRALAEVAPGLAATLAPHGLVVSLLNGVESENEIAAHVGPAQVAAGVAMVSARLDHDGQVLVHGPARVAVAPGSPALADLQEASLAKLAAAMGSAGLGCQRAAHAPTMLWQKLVWNAPFNAICALTGLPAARVLDQPELETLVAEAMREVILVGRAEGATLGAPLVQLMLQLTRSQFPDTEPSMLQDLRAGRLPEIDALQGAVLRAGAKHGLPTPVHVSLHALLRGRASSVSPHWP